MTAIAAASLLLAAPTGCDPTPEKIARWKETERGPGKLREAVQKSGLDPSLRAQALSALVEIGLSQDAVGDLGKVDDKDRKAIIHDAVPRLAEVARGSGIAGSATTRAQREAKDALFALRHDAAPEDRDAADKALIEWTTADLNGRMSAGAHSSDIILTAIGAKAAPRLSELMQPGSSQLVSAAAIFGKVAPTRRSRARRRRAHLAHSEGGAARARRAGAAGARAHWRAARDRVPRRPGRARPRGGDARKGAARAGAGQLVAGRLDAAVGGAAHRGRQEGAGQGARVGLPVLEKMPTSVTGLVGLDA